ncbi:glycosyltransferase family 4 protein [Echinicola vietnamensis]|uniref:Glycosyltransferase n=1 Tax=Echinicola vietnamensis (strain DSM 17526 / LMG 23754 / KMM 6221) TaxID=926556 RepID=L0G1F6_ECHVK|nr:glycosyltransferase family 4 protein [Echinicola vietnamensis]AGA78846.1 glycosyltransferase [Echinicola vietnamensis DSM 17526]
MKILILDTSPVRRGAQVFAAELGIRWREMGHGVRKVYLYEGNKDDERVFLDKEDVVMPFSAHSFFEKFPTVQPGLLKSLGNLLQEYQPDVLLLNGSRTLKYGAFLKRSSKMDFVMVSRVIDNPAYWNSKRIIKSYYKKWVIPALDGAVGVSEASLLAMKGHYAFSKPTKVIHRSFEERKFMGAPSRRAARKMLNLEENDEVVLFLGSFSKQKRPDRFLEIVDHLSQRRPKLKALMVGNGELYPAYRKQLEANPFVFHFGYQSDVAPYLAAADLLLLTSDTEGLPGVVLEAAYFGVPTVGALVGGIQECVEDGESGYLIKGGVVHQFCVKVDFLLDHPEKRSSMGQRAKDIVKERFDLQKSADQFLEFFSVLTKNPQA